MLKEAKLKILALEEEEVSIPTIDTKDDTPPELLKEFIATVWINELELEILILPEITVLLIIKLTLFGA